MSDRELLELAAKAAGIEKPNGIRSDGTWWWYNSCMDGEGRKWNPLTDDGDALRLAVKLAMCIIQDNPGFVVIRCPLRDLVVEIPVQGPDDYLRAMRHAIVRAAAEIGRSMP